MKNLENQIAIIQKFKSETVKVLGKNYFVKDVRFEGKVDPTVILEHFGTPGKAVQFRLDWFVENFQFVDLY